MPLPSETRRRYLLATFIVVPALALAGCGQKGALRLPDPAPEAKPAPATAAPKAEPKTARP